MRNNAPAGKVHPVLTRIAALIPMLVVAAALQLPTAGLAGTHGGATPGDVPPVRIAAFGDSLTAGFGLAEEDAFPRQLEQALRARGYEVEVINAGVSGDTASGGLARLEWSLSGPIDAVIVELGANDALRGVDPAITRQALDEILARLKQRGVKVLLAGMLAPPNLGEAYGAAFNGIYGDLASKYQVALYPFFLDGVAADPRLNQADGLHPTAAGVSVIVERILPAVEALLQAPAAQSSTD